MQSMKFEVILIFMLWFEDCLDIIKQFEKVLVLFAYRSANMVSHSPAQTIYFMLGFTG